MAWPGPFYTGTFCLTRFKTIREWPTTTHNNDTVKENTQEDNTRYVRTDVGHIIHGRVRVTIWRVRVRVILVTIWYHNMNYLQDVGWLQLYMKLI